jgi:hypothetical protein
MHKILNHQGSSTGSLSTKLSASYVNSMEIFKSGRKNQDWRILEKVQCAKHAQQIRTHLARLNRERPASPHSLAAASISSQLCDSSSSSRATTVFGFRRGTCMCPTAGLGQKKFRKQPVSNNGCGSECSGLHKHAMCIMPLSRCQYDCKFICMAFICSSPALRANASLSGMH